MHADVFDDVACVIACHHMVRMCMTRGAREAHKCHMISVSLVLKLLCKDIS